MNKTFIDQVEQYINILLLPLEDYYFHQFEHALDVKNRAVELATKEWLNKQQIEILAIASLFHDSWFIIQYDNNEYIGAKIARNYLKSILYPENKIKIVERLIIATKPDYKKPIDILEEIIIDSDLDNLWRDDFFEKENNLKREIETIKKIKLKKPEWHHATLDLLNSYSYFSKVQRKERSEKKKENTEKLKEMIEELEKWEII